MVYLITMYFSYPIITYVIFKNSLLDCPGFDAKLSEKKFFIEFQKYYYDQRGTQNGFVFLAVRISWH